MRSPPHLLFVSPRFLFPTNEGGKIRTANILRQMKGGTFDLTLASPAPADRQDFSADIQAVCDRFFSWPGVRASRLRRLRAVMGRLPISVATDQSEAGRAQIELALAEQPDIVVVDFPHAAVLLPKRITAASVVFTHNVEAEILERHAVVSTGLRRLVWRDQSRKMRIFEGATLRRFDTVIAVSARDADMLQRRYGPVDVARIETGVDLDFFRFTPPSATFVSGLADGTIVFTGVMDSPANIDGVEFLMKEVWPLVARARPQAQAVIVGRNPPTALVARARDSGIAWSFTGFVDDVRPHVAAAHVAVIPLRVGSGTRIKAFEAMAMGRPVVSTRLGVEGLDIEPEQHFLAADDAKDFALAILRLLGDPGLCDAIARRARARLEERFSWSRVARQFEENCLSALQKSGPDPRPQIPARGSGSQADELVGGCTAVLRKTPR